MAGRCEGCQQHLTRAEHDSKGDKCVPGAWDFKHGAVASREAFIAVSQQARCTSGDVRRVHWRFFDLLYFYGAFGAQNRLHAEIRVNSKGF